MRRCGVAYAAEGHDGGRDPGGPVPIMWGTNTGSEAMQRIAAPIASGIINAPLLAHVRDTCGVPTDVMASGRQIIPSDLLEAATCGELSAVAPGPADSSLR